MPLTRPKDALRKIEAEFVLPQPPVRRVSDVRDGAGSALQQRRVQGLAAAGARMRTLLDCQDLFLLEVRTLLREIDAAVHEEPRARLLTQVRSALEILDWCESVQTDLQAEAMRAEAGEQVFDLLGVCEDAIHDLRGQGTDVARAEITVRGVAERCLHGDVERVGQAIQRAVGLVCERLGGQGPIEVEVDEDEAGPLVRIGGFADAVAEVARERVADFRAAVADAGLRVHPDRLGPASPGLVLRPR